MKISQYVPPSPYPKFDKEITVLDSCLVLPDVELPFHNEPFINHCINLAHTWNISVCILAGDFLHYSALAHFPSSVKNLQEEIDSTEDLVEPFVKSFKKLVWIAGNHDRRPSITLDRVLRMETESRLVIPPELASEFSRKVTTSDYFHCWVGTGEQRWRITHPKATNTVPANAAKAIAIAHNCSTAMAHDHLVGIQQTPDGRHWGAEIGCCVDPERLAYYMQRDTTRPKMKNGALILLKRKTEFIPVLLSEGLVDWNLLQKLPI